MSTHISRRVVPIQYSGYTTCSSCGFPYYPEEADQQSCKLCEASYVRKAEPLPPKKCAGPGCSAMFYPRNSRARYHNEECKLNAAAENRRIKMRKASA